MKEKKVNGSGDGGLSRDGFKRRVFRIETARKIAQFCCFLLFNAGVFGLGPWPVLIPVLQSMGIPQKTVGGAFGALQLMLFEVVFPWLPLASVFLTAAFLGRALCGWACPFGFVQDLLSHLKKSQVGVSFRTHREMVNVKYWLLMSTLFVSGTLAVSLTAGDRGYKEALGVFAPAPFNVLSPADTLFAVLPRATLGARYALLTFFEEEAWVTSEAIFAGVLSVSPLLWIRLIIMAVVIVLVVYIPRGWCRYFCPLGALLAPISRFSFLSLRRDLLRCTRTGCRTCIEACPMMIPILDLPWEKFGDPECIFCLRCVEVCPTKAIKPKFP